MAAVQLYDGILQSAGDPIGDCLGAMQGAVADRERIIRHLRRAETMAYARCQLSRIRYQLREPCDSLKKECDELEALADRVVMVLEGLIRVHVTCGQDPEWTYFYNSLCAIHNIACWTAGRHAIGVFGSPVPNQTDRSPENLQQLRRGMALLDRDIREELPKLWGTAYLDEATASGIAALRWKDSASWLAMRFRYRCRGSALEWFLLQGDAGGIGPTELSKRDELLLHAYAWLSKALGSTVGQGLEREHLVNDIEQARLNLLVLYGNWLAERQRSHSLFVRCGWSIDSAFVQLGQLEVERIDRMKEASSGTTSAAEARLHWLRAILTTIAAFYRLFAREDRFGITWRPESVEMRRISACAEADVVALVDAEFKSCALVSKETTAFQSRRESFRAGFDLWKRELMDEQLSSMGS